MKLIGPEKTKKLAREQRVDVASGAGALAAAAAEADRAEISQAASCGSLCARLLLSRARLCVEIDGQSHDFTSAHDERRDRWLASQGVRTLRISAQDVLRNLDGVLQYIVSEARAPSDAPRASAPPEGE